MGSEKIPKLDIPTLIKKMQAEKITDPSHRVPKFFPYIETYGRKRDCEENPLMNKTIKFREKYVHNRTLRYLEPTFSYNQVLTKIKNEILVASKPRKKSKSRSLTKESDKLQEIINKTECFILKDPQPAMKAGRNSRFRSQVPNGIPRVKKNKSPLSSLSLMVSTPLQGANLTFSGQRKTIHPKNSGILTFYKDSHDIHGSEYFYLKSRFGKNSSRYHGSSSIKNTCDANISTDLNGIM